MFDIITFGSATWDTFFKISSKKIKKGTSFVTGEAICFNLGSKIDIKNMYFSFGGGGVNTATTFVKQGFKTAYCGSIGDDIPGREIIEYLKSIKVETRFTKKIKDQKTNTSVILNTDSEERTILVYRGASETLGKINFKELKSKWFYLAPLSGKLRELTDDIVNFAFKNKIKLAVNFGNSQIAFKKERIKKILSKVDIFILNREEAALITKTSYEDEEKIIKRMKELHQGINVITKGEEGVVVLSGNDVYSAKLKQFKAIDVTGAGDSFSSGFLSGFIKSKGDIEYAIKSGLTNSKYCLLKKGAVNGVLSYRENKLVEKEGIKVMKKLN